MRRWQRRSRASRLWLRHQAWWTIPSRCLVAGLLVGEAACARACVCVGARARCAACERGGARVPGCVGACGWQIPMSGGRGREAEARPALTHATCTCLPSSHGKFVVSLGTMPPQAQLAHHVQAANSKRRDGPGLARGCWHCPMNVGWVGTAPAHHVHPALSSGVFAGAHHARCVGCFSQITGTAYATLGCPLHS